MKIKGTSQVLNRLKNVSRQADLAVKSSIQRNTDQIFDEAIQNVPVEFNHLRASGVPNTQNPYVGIVSFGGDAAPYAPYVEFGTGINVRIPEGFGAYAMQYYVNGKGTMKAQPYLIPAFIKYKKIFLRDMKQIAKNISK